MQVFVDADGCPVVDVTAQLCRKYSMICTLLCDTAHEMYREGCQTIVVDKGADSVDFAIANRVNPGDLVITQDYGLASMCLGKRARVLHQDGWEYTQDNIQALLFQRHESRKFRASGGRVKGPAKRKNTQNQAFREKLDQILSNKDQG